MNPTNRKIKSIVNKFNKTSKYCEQDIPRLSVKSKHFRSIRQKIKQIRKDFPGCGVSIYHDAAYDYNRYSIDCEVFPYKYPVKIAQIRFWFDNGELGKGSFGLLACLWDNEGNLLCNKGFPTIKYKDLVVEVRDFKRIVDEYLSKYTKDKGD